MNGQIVNLNETGCKKLVDGKEEEAGTCVWGTNSAIGQAQRDMGSNLVFSHDPGAEKST